MGFSDWLLGGDDADEQKERTKYQVVARDRDGTAAKCPDVLEKKEWVFEDECPDEEWFKYKYGKHLDPGIRYVCVPLDGRRPEFDSIQWTVEPDGRAPEDEMPRWARELQAELSDRRPTDEDLDIALIREIAATDGPQEALKELKQVKAIESGTKSGLADSVQDPTDVKEIAGRGFLQMSDNYASVGEMIEDIMGGALGAASAGQVGPTGQVQQPAQQAHPADPPPSQQPSPQMPAGGNAPPAESPPPEESSPEPQQDTSSSSLRRRFSGGPGSKTSADPEGEPTPEETAETEPEVVDDEPAVAADGNGEVLARSGAGREGEVLETATEAGGYATDAGAADGPATGRASRPMTASPGDPSPEEDDEEDDDDSEEPTPEEPAAATDGGETR